MSEFESRARFAEPPRETEPSGRMGIIVVGAGNISSPYLEHLATSRVVEAVTIIDPDEGRAGAQAEKFNLTPSSSLEAAREAHPEAELALCLTPNEYHAEIGRQALSAGLHFYTEKPFALSLTDVEELENLAKEKDLRLGAAPDTFLLPKIQKVEQYLKERLIGQVACFTATFAGNGPETWGHPRPEIFYRENVGPVIDMGAYYLTPLVRFFGPIEQVSAYGVSRQTGRNFPVLSPTTVQAQIEFASGVGGSFYASFDGELQTPEPHIKLVGLKGVMEISDPNSYEDTSLRYALYSTHAEQLLTFEDPPKRGVGLDHFVQDIRSGEPSVMDSAVPKHVLEAMLGINESVKTKKPYRMRTTLAATV